MWLFWRVGLPLEIQGFDFSFHIILKLRIQQIMVRRLAAYSCK